jgi:hypothetical protein
MYLAYPRKKFEGMLLILNFKSLLLEKQSELGERASFHTFLMARLIYSIYLKLG